MITFSHGQKKIFHLGCIFLSHHIEMRYENENSHTTEMKYKLEANDDNDKAQFCVLLYLPEGNEKVQGKKLEPVKIEIALRKMVSSR